MPARASFRAFWIRELRRWHWISSAVCLVGMLAFAATGVTLNHAASIEASAVETSVTATLPASLVSAAWADPAAVGGHVPAPVADAVREALGVDIAGRAAEWTDYDVYVALPRPGGDGYVVIDRATGEVEYAHTDRGWIAWLNDLHKGRHTGPIWSVFLDVFAIGCVVFCLTGLLLLHVHAPHRPMTWPVVGAGLLVPLVIALWFLHA